MSLQYKFNNFYFKNGYLLTSDLCEIALAPKEKAVLHFLLERANTVITKEALITHVWRGGMVSDESLTRCIYVLRRALGQSDTNRFIETVYGKGYRFTPKVEMIAEGELAIKYGVEAKINSAGTCSIALFPFEMKRSHLSSSLHDQLIGWLCHLKVVNNLPINVISSFFTRIFQGSNGFLSEMEKSRADYYIAGVEISGNNHSIMRVELVRASDYSVLHREGVQLVDDYYASYRALCRAILSLLKFTRVGDGIKLNLPHEIQSNVTPAVSDEMSHFTVSELKRHISSVRGRSK